MASELMVEGAVLRAAMPCRECALTLAEIPPMLAPSDDELAYVLDEWPASDRALITAALAELGIRYRWEPELMLVVPDTAEDAVDAVLDDVESQSISASEVEREDVEAADGGPAAQAAMGDLFVITDRLQHSPFDVAAGKKLVKTVAFISESAPPFGIDRTAWQQIRELGSAVNAEVDAGQDGDLIAANARKLRDVLRVYV